MTSCSEVPAARNKTTAQLQVAFDRCPELDQTALGGEQLAHTSPGAATPTRRQISDTVLLLGFRLFGCASKPSYGRCSTRTASLLVPTPDRRKIGRSGGNKFPGSAVSVCVVRRREQDNEGTREWRENAAVSVELLSRAQSGDQQAFAQLTDGYRRELKLHCYRILGSTQDAEDAVQETFISAWQALANFEERASIRTWLYRIATNRCLNMRRAASRRPEVDSSLNATLPEPTRLGEVVGLEPYPDILLDVLPDDSPGPDARYESRGSVSVAFITVLHLLPLRRRLALGLRALPDYDS